LAEIPLEGGGRGTRGVEETGRKQAESKNVELTERNIKCRARSLHWNILDLSEKKLSDSKSSARRPKRHANGERGKNDEEEEKAEKKVSITLGGGGWLKAKKPAI